MPFIDFQPDKPLCNSPEHNPPGLIVLQPGWHTWQCPQCGEIIRFHVAGVTC